MLLKIAKSRGAKTVNGYAMFCSQAEETWKIWNKN
jgi:shikimate 5-dehydrogenase